MPTYEYRCKACGHRFERLQKFSDDPVRICPDCGEDQAERLISAGAGVVFRGSGFYETDYKRKSGGRSSGEGSGGDGDGGDGGESGSAGSGGEGSSGDGPDGGGPSRSTRDGADE